MMIPDCQVKKGVPLNHLNALGNYIVAKQPDVLVNIGDFADMKSLSSYDKAGSKNSENGRVRDDFDAAIEAMEVFMAPIYAYNKGKHKKKQYNPRMEFCLGNHEDRITRAIEDNPRHFEGIISLDHLQYESFGWNVNPFLDVITIGGVNFSHYFINPKSLKKNVLGGTCESKLTNLGGSFAMGHQQTLQIGMIPKLTDNGKFKMIQGLVAGAFYQHDEGYMGPQGNPSHWRGAVMMNDVRDGMYDIMPLSMNYLLDNWDF